MAGCSSQPVLQTSDGVSVASFYEPVFPEKGVAILFHGLGAGHREWDDFRRGLKTQGWSTLAIDFRGHGLSTRTAKGPIHWKVMTEEDMQAMVHDVEAAVQFVKGRKHIWLIGSSAGAAQVLKYAVTDPSVQGVILLSPKFHPRIVSPSFWEGFGSRPVFIAGSQDDAGIAENGEAIHQQLAKSELRMYPGIGHGAVMLKNEPLLEKEILKWMDQNNL